MPTFRLNAPIVIRAKDKITDKMLFCTGNGSSAIELVFQRVMFKSISDTK